MRATRRGPALFGPVPLCLALSCGRPGASPPLTPAPLAQVQSAPQPVSVAEAEPEAPRKPAPEPVSARARNQRSPYDLTGIRTRVLTQLSGRGSSRALSIWVDISWDGEGDMQVAGTPAPNLMGQNYDGQSEVGGFGDGCAANIDPAFNPDLRRGRLRTFGPRVLRSEELPPDTPDQRIVLDVGLCKVQLADGRWVQLHAGTVTYETKPGARGSVHIEQRLWAD